MEKECPNCFQGRIVDPEKSDEADKLYDSGMFNYYEAILKAGSISCPQCKGTGRLKQD